MPIGLRGVGKTVSLNRFAEIAEHEGLKVAFIEAPESAAFRTLLAIRLRRVLLDLDNGPAKRAITKALGVLRSFTLQLPDGSSIGIGVDALAGQADSGILSEDLTDLLVAAGEAAAERRSGVCSLSTRCSTSLLQTSPLSSPLCTALPSSTCPWSSSTPACLSFPVSLGRQVLCRAIVRLSDVRFTVPRRCSVGAGDPGECARGRVHSRSG